MDKKRTLIVFVTGIIIMAALVLLNTMTGSVNISPAEVMDFFGRNAEKTMNYNIIMNIRLPRIISANEPKEGATNQPKEDTTKQPKAGTTKQPKERATKQSARNCKKRSGTVLLDSPTFYIILGEINYLSTKRCAGTSYSKIP